MSDELQLLRMKLREQLVNLADGLGVWKPDLLRALDSKMPDLASYWGIRTSDGLASARGVIFKNLAALIRRLEPRPTRDKLSPGQKVERYRFVIATSFNLPYAKKPQLARMSLERRRVWLSELSDEELNTTPASSPRDLTHAIDQMVEIMVTEHAARPATVEPESSSEQLVRSSVGVGLDESPPQVEQAQSAVSEDSNEQAGRSWFWQTHPLTTIVAVVVTVALAIGVPVAVNWRGSNKPAVAGAEDFIRSTVTAIGSLGGGLGIAYASDQTEHAKQVAAELAKINAGFKGDKAGTGVYDKDYDIALREIKQGGAYLLRGMQISVEVEGLADSEITINDVIVRPALKPVPFGTAMVLYNSGGGDKPRIMRFNMDKPNPIARQDAGPDKPGAPFFEVERIGLPKGHKESLVMMFQAESVASEFNIEIRYEVGGKKYAEKVDLWGHPFRIAPVACPPGTGSLANLPADIRRLKSSLYEHAYNFGLAAGKDEQASMDPKKFSELRCNF